MAEKTADDSNLSDPVVAPLPEKKHKRDDRDNETAPAYQIRKAADEGKQWMMKNGKVVIFDENDLESKAATLTFTDGVTPIISGKFMTTTEGVFTHGVLQHLDPKTGKMTNAVFTPKTPPAGCKDVLKIRHKPDYTGDNDDYDDEDTETTPIGKGAPGSEGLTTAKAKLAGYIANASSAIQSAQATIASINQQIGELV